MATYYKGSVSSPRGLEISFHVRGLHTAIKIFTDMARKFEVFPGVRWTAWGEPWYHIPAGGVGIDINGEEYPFMLQRMGKISGASYRRLSWAVIHAVKEGGKHLDKSTFLQPVRQGQTTP